MSMLWRWIFRLAMLIVPFAFRRWRERRRRRRLRERAA
jgi:hypothetical protein